MYTDEHAKAGINIKHPIIETWPNQFSSYEIEIEITEFTSICPKTSLPDFGVITIKYQPDQKCAELKSLKEYFLSYRMLGIFYENVINCVLRDFVKDVAPLWCEVSCTFNSRGGLSSKAKVSIKKEI